MADGTRIYPVKYLIMHHAVSNDMVDWDDYKVQKWFSDVGRTRGYDGISNSKHYFPGTKTMSYSQAHFCLHWYFKDNNKYGWRLTQLIDDPWNNTCWHAGNYPINQQSIGIEVAGNYSGAYLEEKALMLVADFWRAHDKSLNGNTLVRGHKDVSKKATACPGKIYEQLNTLKDMINNPDKWNEKLWPTTPKPQPQPEPKPMRTQDNLYHLIKGNWETLLNGSEQIGAYSVNPADTIANLKAELLALEEKGKVTKAELEETIENLQAEIANFEKQGGGIDQDTKDAIVETNGIVKSIWEFLTKIFK